MKKMITAFCLAMLMAMTMLTGCSKEAASTDSSAAQTEVLEIGEGKTAFVFEAKDNEGNVTQWNVHTDETTVGAALVAVDLIKGEDSEFGLMVSEVNGLVADYNTDKAYWAFYVDGEYATAGVDSTNIEENKTYSFVYTKE